MAATLITNATPSTMLVSAMAGSAGARFTSSTETVKAFVAASGGVPVSSAITAIG